MSDEGGNGFYFSLEEKYYSLMDKLQESGLKVYDWFVTPLEGRGVPSFPIAVLLLLFAVLGAAFLLRPPSGVPVQVVVSSSGGEPLAGARVTLYYGEDSVEKTTDSSGSARFDSLPPGIDASLRVSLEGYDAAVTDFALELGEGASALLKQVTLSSLEAEKPELTVTVANAQGAPVGGAALLFSDPSTGERLERSTDASGNAFLEFEDGSEIFKLTIRRNGFVEESKTCFASQGTCFVELKAEETVPVDEGGKKEAAASVVVRAKGADGTGVKGKASLFDAATGQLLNQKFTGEDGAALFESVAVGTRVYASFSPDDTSYWDYPGFDGIQTVAAGGIEFRLNLQEKGEASTGAITVSVADEEGAELAGARVSLYSLENPLSLLASTSTNDFGAAEMEVASNTKGYVTVFVEGFLPHLEKLVSEGDELNVVLEKTVPGNNGAATVTVRDPEGDKVPFARVSLLTADGFQSGVPEAETLDDGTASFNALPLREFRGLARKGSASGEGDAFKVTVSDEAESTVWLEPTYAYLKVGAVDATEQPRRNVAVTVEAFLDGEKISSCRTGAGSTNVSCRLKVRANKPVVLKVSDGDYSDYESEEIVLSTGQEAAKTVQLVPASYSEELSLISFELVDAATFEPVDVVEKGRFYRALLTVSLPSEVEKSGFFLLAGGQGGVEGSQAVITSWSGAEGAAFSFGDYFRPEYSCFEDESDVVGGEEKWVSAEFEEGFGVRTLSAKVFISPEAKGSVSFDYRAFAEKNGYWFREPVDPVLGDGESAGSKEACRALTETKSFDVVSGSATCNKDACLAIELSTRDRRLPNGLPVEVDREFAAVVEARVFESVSSPYLKVSAPDGQVLFTEFLKSNSSKELGSDSFTVNLALDELGSDSLAFKALAGMPSDYALIEFVLGHSDGELLRAQRFVTITGKGEFVFAVKPGELVVGKRSGLAATLASKSGAPIEDARIEIVEVEGYPFSSSPNGDYFVAGDGSRGAGEDGKYEFDNLVPVAPGVIEVVAEKPGFADAVREIPVKALDWLEFYPGFGTIELDCGGASLRVENLLESEVEVLASFEGDACASLSGPGLEYEGENEYSLSINGLGEAQLFLEPAKYGKCYLSFNSVLESSGSAFTKTGVIDVSCEELKPDEGSKNCSSANCGACSEEQCLDLMEKGNYCYPDYAVLSDGNSSFLGCLLNETTAGLAEETCSAENCGLCGEEECLELQEEGACLAEYGNYFNGSQAFTSCTRFSKDECVAANFDFKSILARRLAQYHSNQIFNPSESSRYIASTADNYVVVSPYGIRVSAGGNGCDGGSSLSCKKEISALIPTNGIAFSVQNSFGQDTQIFVKGGSEKCFKVIDLERDKPSLRSLVTNLVDVGSEALLLPANQYRTYAIIFDPSEGGCLEYVFDESGGLSISHSEPWTIELKVGTSGFAGNEARIKLKITEDDSLSELGLVLMPLGGETIYRNSNAKEPVLGVNNVQTGGDEATLKVSGDSLDPSMELPPLSWAYSESDLSKDGSLTVKRGSEEVGEAFLESSPAAASGSADVIGAPGSDGEGLLRCSRTGYCTPEEIEEVKSEIESEVSDAYQDFYDGLDKVDEASLVRGSADVFEKALDDAIADFVAAKATYAACKAIGVDPLADLQASCSYDLTSPQTASGSFSEVYGDAFSFTSCNSQLFNYLSGSSQQYGPQFWASFKNGLQGMLTPREGTLQHLEPIIDLSDLKVIVPVKSSGETSKNGEKGGIRLLQFKFDPANSFGEGTSDWVLVDEIDGTPWNSIYETPLTGPSKTNALNLFLDAFDYSGTQFPAFTSLPYPFVEESGEVAWDEYGSPNLLTMNKHGFNWGALEGFDRDEEAIAGESTLIKAVATSTNYESYLKVDGRRLHYGGDARQLIEYFLFEDAEAPCNIQFNEDYTEAWCGGGSSPSSGDSAICSDSCSKEPVQRDWVECMVKNQCLWTCTTQEPVQYWVDAPSEPGANTYYVFEGNSYAGKQGDGCFVLATRTDGGHPSEFGPFSRDNWWYDWEVGGEWFTLNFHGWDENEELDVSGAGLNENQLSELKEEFNYEDRETNLPLIEWMDRVAYGQCERPLKADGGGLESDALGVTFNLCLHDSMFGRGEACIPTRDAETCSSGTCSWKNVEGNYGFYCSYE